MCYRCDGKKECSVEANKGTFGIDPCEGVPKYLEMDYECVEEQAVPTGKTI